MIEINRQEELKIVNNIWVNTLRIFVDGPILDTDIALLEAELGEVVEHSIVLYKKPSDADEAVQTEIKRVADVVTELLNGTNNDTLVMMLNYIEDWTEGEYAIGDVRKYNAQPKICCQTHDSTGNPTWTPDVASLWSPYHAKSAEYALPWIQPTGAQDIYKTNEYMIFTDNKKYKCLQDTNFSPTEYAAAWQEIV